MRSRVENVTLQHGRISKKHRFSRRKRKKCHGLLSLWYGVMSDSGTANLLGECSKQDHATDPFKATLSQLYAPFMVYAPTCIHRRFLALRVVCENSALIVTAKFSAANGWKSIDAQVSKNPDNDMWFYLLWMDVYLQKHWVWTKATTSDVWGEGAYTHTLFSVKVIPHFPNIYLLFFLIINIHRSPSPHPCPGHGGKRLNKIAFAENNFLFYP